MEITYVYYYFFALITFVSHLYPTLLYHKIDYDQTSSIFVTNHFLHAEYFIDNRYFFSGLLPANYIAWMDKPSRSIQTLPWIKKSVSCLFHGFPPDYCGIYHSFYLSLQGTQRYKLFSVFYL